MCVHGGFYTLKFSLFKQMFSFIRFNVFKEVDVRKNNFDQFYAMTRLDVNHSKWMLWFSSKKFYNRAIEMSNVKST